MGINLFAKPKKMAAETWLNTIADAVLDVYFLSDEDGKIVKKALYNGSTGDGTITYKKFISELKITDFKGPRPSDLEDKDKVPPIGEMIANSICPVMLKKNNWTTFFDEIEGKGLDSLSAKAIRNALKNSYDQDFSDFILKLWAAVNIPELY